ncbi:MAG: ABC transporter substrate-binding protein, partial [Dehalococcoidia bacterium]|nr:ABC transporter substrate-binding protein [Dehalococcoidia bacterium]
MAMRPKWIGCILAAVMVSALGLTACTPTPAPAKPGESSAATKPYGSLTIAPNFSAGSFIHSSGKGLYIGSVYDGVGGDVFDELIGQTTRGELIPQIAERWEISSDGMTHTFYIKKGVKFHNGDDLTGADVKFSLEMQKATQSRTDWTQAYDRVDLKDDYTVVLRLKLPRFDVLVGLETSMGAGAVLPKRYIEEKGWDYWGLNPVGSGPYRVVKWEVGDRLELEAVEDHWRATPKFKNITLLNVKEEGAKVAMLKTGELDMAVISPESVAAIKAAGLRVLGHYGTRQWRFSPFWDFDNPKDHAFGDLRVRKALSLAIDRKELADKLAGGYGQPASVYAMSRVAQFYNADEFKPDPFDPEMAKKLLAESGYPNGFDAKIWDTGGGGIISTVGLALSGYWHKVGIRAALQPVDFAVLLPKMRAKGDISQRPTDMFGTIAVDGTGGRLGLPTLDMVGWPAGLVGMPNPRLNELLSIIPVTADPGKRLATEAVRLARDGYSGIAILDIDDLYATRS